MVGDTISHYRIIAKLGEGGMGVVYKAEDVSLERTVALKFLRPDAVGSDEERARLIREAQAAARLDHPNVCTIHEIDTVDGETFVTMAYVEGEDLKARIAARPLPIDDALDIAIQVAEGLAAAHDEGIVHRDIKPANVIVTPKGRAKVMDFGLAHVVDQTRLTKTGTTTGTVAYMSPEQARGEEVDRRTDIWSLGVTLYEMLTGQCPFRGASEQAVIYSILNEPPEPMTALRTGVPVDLERVASKAMAKRPAERYQDAADLLVDLRAIRVDLGIQTATVATAPAAADSPRRWGKRGVVTVAIVLAVAAIVTGVALVRLRGVPSELSLDHVVVAAFENRTGDPSLDPVGPMAADWITQGLSQIGVVQVVPTMTPLGPATRLPGEGGEGGASTIESLAEATGAGTVVSGAYYLDGGDLRFQAEITDASRGRLLHTLPPSTGPRGRPMEAMTSIRQRIMGALAAEFDPHLPSHADIQPPLFEAYREYAVGTELFGTDYAAAIHHFERAADLDSTFMAPRFELAYSYNNRREYAKADSVFRLIDRNRDRLTPYQRLIVRSQLANLGGSIGEALSLHRQAAELVPPSFFDAFLIGQYAVALNRPGEAVEAFEEAKRLSESTASISRAWLAGHLARAHHLLGNHEKELAEIREACERYPDNLRLRVAEVRALAALGHIDEIDRVINESLGMSGSGSPGEVMRAAAIELRAHDHREDALRIAERAVEWYRGRPAEEAGGRRHRQKLAGSLYVAERWEEAAGLFEELLREDPDGVSNRGHLGTIAARRGDRAEAERLSAELEDLARPYLFGVDSYFRADIAALLGERDRAVELLREAHAAGCGSAIPMGLHNDMDLESLRGYPPFEELRRPKG